MRLLFTILQVVLSIFSENPELSAGNLCGYFPQDTTVTAAPKGYKPFYISHIGRHGSRFLGKSSMDCFQVIDTLAFYAGKEMLTEDGLSLLEELRVMYGLANGHEGELTALGALEHRQICARMVRHYPEVFSDPARTHVDAYSTTTQRVIDSMDAFLSELSARAPGLQADTHLAKHNKLASQEVIGNKVSQEQQDEAKKKEKELYKLGKELRKGRNDYSSFGARIFREPEQVPAKTVSYVAKSSFKAFKTGRVTEPETMPSMGKYLTANELYPLWVSHCIGWLKNVNMPGYVSPFVITRGYGIIERIVADADEAIQKTSSTAATLRFSHDTYLLPLMNAIPLEGAVVECDEMAILDHFQDFNVFCPACNVQLIFYRNKRGSVLVKFLLNEKETLVHGLAPKTGCYYDWNSVKEFWASR